jgi:hypothetical protein
MQRRVEAMLARRYGPRMSRAAAVAAGLLALVFLPLSLRASPGQAPPSGGADGAARFLFAAKLQPIMVVVSASNHERYENHPRIIDFDPECMGDEYALEFWPRVKLAGQARFADGRPAPRLPMIVEGASLFERRRYTATTSDAGEFEIEGAANDYYLLAAGDRDRAGSTALVVGRGASPSSWGTS